MMFELNKSFKSISAATFILIAAVVGLQEQAAGFGSTPYAVAGQVQVEVNKDMAGTRSLPAEKQIFDSKLKLLDQKAQDKLFAKRVNGNTGLDFASYANKFFVFSRMDLDISLGLATKDKTISDTRLENAFPSDYKPTVRELLDAIAMQTNSHWTYNPEAQLVKTEERTDQLIDGIAIIEFTPATDPLPVELTPANNWKNERRTNWMMYIPPTLPLAMDLHVLGRISADDPSKQAESIAKAPLTCSLEIFKRVKSTAAARDLQKVKVGDYDSYFFQHDMVVKTQNIRWRQWYFTVGDQLCYIISTIPKEDDEKLLPDIQAMLKTVRPAAKH